MTTVPDLRYPRLAIVDKQDDLTVIWHVETGADGPSASGMLSGAWILGDGEVAPKRLADLTAGAVVIDSDEADQVLEDIHALLIDAVASLKKAASEAKKKKSTLTAPTWQLPGKVDVDKHRSTFHGEDVAREAWSYAMAAGELVEAWHVIESQRRSRKYLQEEFGERERPIPLPEGLEDSAR